MEQQLQQAAAAHEANRQELLEMQDAATKSVRWSR